MTESGKRIKKVITYLGLNINSFSREVGMTNNVTIGRILNEDRNPHPRTLQKIVARFPKINYTWLLTGDGEMLNREKIYSSKSESDDLGDLLLAVQHHSRELMQHGEELRKQGERLDRMIDVVELRQKGALPLVSQSKHQNSPPHAIQLKNSDL